MRYLLALLITCAAYAQNPATAKFPGAIVAPKDLGIASHFQTTLNGAITASDTSATLTSGTGVLDGMILRIENESLLVCGHSGTTVQFGYASCPNVDGRGIGSTAASHADGKTVSGYVPSTGWNQLIAEMIAAQTAINAKAGTIASGTASLGTSAIASGACATVVTVSASGVATTDVIWFNPNASVKAVTGYAPGGGLSIRQYPTADNVNFDVCNETASSITPGAVTLNWRVVR